VNNYWSGKLALITGASGGIGESVSRALAQRGIRVILVARRTERLDMVASDISQSGGQAYVYQTDLTNPSERASLSEKILHDQGIPEILINNAGMGWYGFFSKMPWEVARDLIELNISSTTHLTSLFLPHMLTLTKARIINIGSIAGKLPEQGIALYSASKAYLDTFTKSLSRELRGTQTSISVLRAGPVKTDFFNRAFELPAGGRIPGEFFAVPPERVSQSVWRLIQFPSRYAYVPGYLSFSPLLEILFSWVIDLVGPILLRRSENKLT
jgi:short-subunit dehydrogenase